MREGAWDTVEMAQSLNRTAGRVEALAALNLSGADAIGFAQRVCANDVATLAPGDWQWNCLLSPQGRVLALFRLWRRASDILTLVLPAFALPATLVLLKRYVLRSKLVVEVADIVLVGGSSLSLTPAGATMHSSDGRWLALAEAGDPGLADACDVSEYWRTQDLACGVPWLDPEALETFTAQALSLDRLEAFSVRKGCYPGQEIVARMHFLGQNKRELRRFASARDVGAGTPVCATGPVPRTLGTVVAVVQGPAGTEILAVLQHAAGDAQLFAGAACDVPLTSLSFNAPPLPAALPPLDKA